MTKRIHSLHYSTPSPGSPPSLPGPVGVLGRVLALAAGGAVILAGLFVSALVFSVLLVVGVVAGGWFWWKTRDLRRSLGERMAQMQRMQAGMPAGEASAHPADAGPGSQRPGAPGEVLDGDFIRETADRSR